jgi:hypothetical protein
MLKVLISLTSAIIIFGTATSISYAAGSQSGHFIAEMDRDRNGTVSRAEFLSYAARTSKRLDAIGSFHRSHTSTPEGAKPKRGGRRC